MIIDRFEGAFAVVEIKLGEYIKLERNKLPKIAKEGDCIIFSNGVYKIDETETKKRREEIIRLQRSLWE